LCACFQQFPAPGNLCCPVTICHEPEVTDAMEAGWQDMQQEAPDELGGTQSHDFVDTFLAVILPVQPDSAVNHVDQAAIGDGNPVGITAKISQHLPRSPERAFGIDDPVDTPQLATLCFEGCRIGKVSERSGEPQAACRMRTRQLFEKQPPEQAAENPHGQEEPFRAGYPA
jgi:hypothetical protein